MEKRETKRRAIGGRVSAWDEEEDFLAALQKFLAGRVASLRLGTPEGERPYLEVEAKTPPKTRVVVHATILPGDEWVFGWRIGPPGRRVWPAGDPEGAADELVAVLEGLEGEA